VAAAAEDLAAAVVAAAVAPVVRPALLPVELVALVALRKRVAPVREVAVLADPVVQVLAVLLRQQPHPLSRTPRSTGPFLELLLLLARRPRRISQRVDLARSLPRSVLPSTTDISTSAIRPLSCESRTSLAI
jgi:hypothetical protein